MAGRGYTNPDAAGYLLEADACKKVEAELRRIADKYQRKIDREQAAREAEFEAAMQYRSENELLEAYGWEIITEKQYESIWISFAGGVRPWKTMRPQSTKRLIESCCVFSPTSPPSSGNGAFRPLPPPSRRLRSSARRKRNRSGMRGCGRSERIWTSPRNPMGHRAACMGLVRLLPSVKNRLQNMVISDKIMVSESNA